MTAQAKVSIIFDADGKDLIKSLEAANEEFDELKKNVKESGKSAATAANENKKLNNSLDNTRKKGKETSLVMGGLKKAFGIVAAAFSVGSTLSAAEQYQNLTQQVKLATDGFADFETTQRAIYDISQSNGTAIATTTNLYRNIARTAPELNASNEQVLLFTNSIQQLGVIGNSTQAELNNGLRQLAQGMAGGVLRAEEFNSIIENTPEIANTIAKAMGVTVGQLRLMVNDGKVLSSDVFNAILSQSADIQATFDEMPFTMARGFQYMRNAAFQFFGEMNEQSGSITNLLGEGFRQVGVYIEQFTSYVTSGLLTAEFSLWIDYLKGIGSAFVDVANFAKDGFDKIIGLIGLTRADLYQMFLEYPAQAEFAFESMIGYAQYWYYATAEQVALLGPSAQSTWLSVQQTAESMWLSIKLASAQAVDFMISRLADFVSSAAATVEKLPGIGDNIASGIRSAEDALRGYATASQTVQQEIDQSKAAFDSQNAVIEQAKNEITSYYGEKKAAAQGATEDARVERDTSIALMNTQVESARRAAQAESELTGEKNAGTTASQTFTKATTESNKAKDESEKASKKAADALKNYTQSIKDQVAALTAGITGGQRAMEIEREFQKLRNQGIDITRDVVAANYDLVESLEEQMQAQERAREASEEYTKSKQDEIAVLQARLNGGERAAEVEREYQRLQEQGVDITREEIDAHEQTVAAMEAQIKVQDEVTATLEDMLKGSISTKEGLKSLAVEGVKYLITELTGLSDFSFKGIFDALLNGAKSLFGEGSGGGLGSIFSSGLGKLTGIFKDVFAPGGGIGGSSGGGIWGSIINGAKSLFSGGENSNLGSIFSKGLGKITGIFKDVGGGTGNGGMWSNVLSGAQKLFSGGNSSVNGAFQSGFGNIVSYAKTAASAVSKFFGGASAAASSSTAAITSSTAAASSAAASAGSAAGASAGASAMSGISSAMSKAGPWAALAVAASKIVSPILKKRLGEDNYTLLGDMERFTKAYYEDGILGSLKESFKGEIYKMNPLNQVKDTFKVVFGSGRSHAEVFKDELLEVNNALQAGNAHAVELAGGFEAVSRRGNQHFIGGENLAQLQEYLSGVDGLKLRLQEVNGEEFLRIGDKAQLGFDKIQEIINGFVAGKPLDQLVNAAQAADPAWQTLKTGAQGVTEALSSSTQQWTSMISQSGKDGGAVLRNELGGAATDATKKINSAAGSMASALKSSSKEGSSAIKTNISSAANDFQSKMKSASNASTGAIRSFGSSGRIEFNSLNSFLSSLINNFKNFQNQANKGVKIPISTSGSIPSGASVASYNVGTSFVRGDQLAQIHDREMVIDPRSSDVLRKYGINVNTPAASVSMKPVIDMLQNVVRAIENTKLSRSNNDIKVAIEGVSQEIKKQTQDLMPRNRVGALSHAS